MGIKTELRATLLTRIGRVIITILGLMGFIIHQRMRQAQPWTRKRDRKITADNIPFM